MATNGAAAGKGPMTKRFPVFDCDAHINDPLEIWSEYVDPKHRDLVKQSYWRDDRQTIINGRARSTGGGANGEFPRYNVITISGPGMDRETKRLLQYETLTPEKRDYLDHKGAYDPHERIKDLDLMGIDQVMVIPTGMVGGFAYIDNIDGAHALARGYNDWAHDFCSANPDRLHAAGWLPLQNSTYSIDELYRIAGRGTRMALVRPIDARGNYPTRINAYGPVGGWDALFRTFEETGTVLGMHTFPSTIHPLDLDMTRMVSPGQLIDSSAHGIYMAQGLNSQTLSFIYEAAVWLSVTLMSGFLDRYSKLTMAILESNASWLIGVLERLDRHFDLYANERRMPAKRRPSEAFFDQCYISFESDEMEVFRQADVYRDVGVWASDVYHHDGTDVWEAIEAMERAEVPEETQAALLGGNARRMYGIEPKTFVSEQAADPARPDWFPSREQVAEFAREQSEPGRAEMLRAQAEAAGPQGGALRQK